MPGQASYPSEAVDGGEVSGALSGRPAARRLRAPPRRRVRDGLGLDPDEITRDDSFFEQGGTSLSAVKLVIALNRAVTLKGCGRERRAADRRSHVGCTTLSGRPASLAAEKPRSWFLTGGWQGRSGEVVGVPTVDLARR